MHENSKDDRHAAYGPIGRRRPDRIAARAPRGMARGVASLALLTLASGVDELDLLPAGVLPDIVPAAAAETTPSVAEVLERRYLEGIRDRVSIALDFEFRDEFCEEAEFDVEASPDGVVTLGGRVCEASSRDRADEIARRQFGVTDVVLRLSVRQPGPGRESGAGTSSPAESRRDWLAGVDPTSSDADMSLDLAASLAAYMGSPARADDGCFSDPRVVAEGFRVEVDVDEETLRLSGVVEEEARRARVRSWARWVLRHSERIRDLDVELAARDESGFWGVFGF